MDKTEKRLKALEIEIDYYKGLSGKIFTADVLVIGATTTVIKTSGFCFWSIMGVILSYIFTVSLLIFIKEWKDRVNHVKELCNVDT